MNKIKRRYGNRDEVSALVFADNGRFKRAKTAKKRRMTACEKICLMIRCFARITAKMWHIAWMKGKYPYKWSINHSERATKEKMLICGQAA